MSKYKNYIILVDVTEIALSSKATTAKTTSVAITSIGIAYSIPTAFATATIYGSLLTTVNTKLKNEFIKFSQMSVLSKQFRDKFIKLYIKSIIDNEIDKDENNKLVKVYED